MADHEADAVTRILRLFRCGFGDVKGRDSSVGVEESRGSVVLIDECDWVLDPLNQNSTFPLAKSQSASFAGKVAPRHAPHRRDIRANTLLTGKGVLLDGNYSKVALNSIVKAFDEVSAHTASEIARYCPSGQNFTKRI